MPYFENERKTELRQIRNRLREIQGAIFSPSQTIDKIEICVTGPGKGPEPPPQSGWKPFQIMDRWGGHDQTTWFRLRARVPLSFRGARVAAIMRLAEHSHWAGVGPRQESGEALAYVNGKPFQGVDRNHDFIVLTEKARGGESFEILLEACPSTWLDMTHVFSRAELAVMNMPVWDFYWDGTVYLDVVEALDPDSEVRRRLQALVDAAVRGVDLQHRDGPSFAESLRRARRLLHEGLKDFETSHHLGKLTLIGHSHIDTAWLWPLREARRKVGRTWATMLRLMEQYPEFVFAASQPELYMFAKEHHPELWRQIKRRVKDGRWEPCGASWVEQDNNVPSGEALVRQFLYGNRFYVREFGVRSRTAWLPDAFGYPWTLPQILRKCGMDTFCTIKISWSQYTRFPYGYFHWQGLDGTRIPAVMMPLNYNGDTTPRDCIRQRADFQQKELLEEAPLTFGWGDGGGGPTPKMIEYGRRLKNIVGVPRCAFGRTEDCLDRMHAEAAGKKIPVHNGELYLELHRACQTTQARTKRNNRKCEFLLQNAEWLSVLAMLHGGRYDQKTLQEAWRILLTHQFHDILPGSSITEVYKDADKNYAVVRDLGRRIRDQAVAYLCARMDTPGPGIPLAVFNPLSWMRADVATAKTKLPKGDFHIVAPDGNVVPSQRVGLDEVLFETQPVPPLGYAVYRLLPGAAQPRPAGMLRATTKSLENDYLRIRLDAFGRFTSVYDKVEGREVIAPGQRGNMLQLFDDRPASNDAWDVDHNFAARMWEPGRASIEIVENGPVRAVVRVTRRTERSTFIQDITLYAMLPRVDIINRVDWHEKRTLLKVAFPVGVLSHRAVYHIQFGTVERATHQNTDFDRARFEVAGHHWADLSEGDYGVSLLNDCKYGYDVLGNTLRLSLLRAPVEPDPCADQGEHEFVYSLFPHAGDWRCGTVQQGYELNQPLLVVAAPLGKGALPAVAAFAAVDADNVIISAVKKAEDSDAVIMRLYEACGQRGDVTVTFGATPTAVTECDMMEENDAPVRVRGNEAMFYIRPYEIRTFKVRFSGKSKRRTRRR